MVDDLPTEFDLIVVGTGLTESILAAAASRVGKTVLHLDANEYYGGFWASFNLEALQSFADSCNETKAPNLLIDNGNIKIWENFSQLQDVQMAWHIPESEPIKEHDEEEMSNKDEPAEKNTEESLEENAAEPVEKSTEESVDENAAEQVKKSTQESVEKQEDWTKEKVMKDFRRFNIDLTPKVLFSGGSLVQLLISSNICRYAEFRAVDRIATLLDGEIKTVPCSRSDVFATKDVNVVEKRVLMKLLESCMTYEDGQEEYENLKGITFQKFLLDKNLPDKVTHYMLHAISMSTDKTSFEVGVANTKKFITSLGRYGNTPFLFPMYGCGEIPQCFCRLCAVFGGIYCLKRPIEKMDIDQRPIEKKRISIKVGNQMIQTEDIILGPGTISVEGPEQNSDANGKKVKCGKMSRGIFIVSSPLGGVEQNKGGGGVALLKLPPTVGSDTQGAIVIQLTHYSGTCPKGLYIIHITCESNGNPLHDLEPYVSQLLAKEEEKPVILFSLYFTIPQCFKCDNNDLVSNSGLHHCCGPFFELDFDESIQQARDIFAKIYPDDEFLPRAPDPEEIIIGGEDETEKKEVSELSANIEEKLDITQEEDQSKELAIEEPQKDDH